MPDSITPTTTTPAQTRRRVAITIRIACGLAFPVLLLFAASAWLNARRLPAELKKTPAYLKRSNPESAGPASGESSRTKSAARPEIPPWGSEEKIRERLVDFSSVFPLADDLPLPSPSGKDRTKQILLLKKYRAMLDRAYRNAEEGVSLLETESNPFVTMDYLVKLMITDGRLSLAEGRLREAERAYLDAYKTISLLHFQFRATPDLPFKRDDIILFPNLTRLNVALGEWIESGAMPPAMWKAFQAELDLLASSYSKPRHLAYLQDYVRILRATAVRIFEEIPWNNPYYGWAYSLNPEFYHMKSRIAGLDINMPNFFMLGDNAWYAMRNKARCGACLKAFDEYWPKALALAAQDYPAQRDQAMGGFRPPNILFYYASCLPVSGMEIYDSSRQRCLALTTLNLDRVALRWMQGERNVPADGSIDFKAHPDHPWRDPYPEKALMIDTSGPEVRIYSLGPYLRMDYHSGWSIQDCYGPYGYVGIKLAPLKTKTAETTGEKKDENP